MGGAWIMSQHIPDDKSRSDLGNLHELRGKRLVAQEERASCLNILRTQIAVDLRNLQVTRQKDLLRSESTRRFALYLRTGVVLMLQLESSPHGRRGSCLNIFRTTNRIDSETFTNYEAKDCCAMSQHVGSRCTCEPEWFGCSNWSRLGMGGGWIMSQHIPDDKSQAGSQKPSRIYEAKDLLRIRSAWRSVDHVSHIPDANRGWISETFMNYEAKDLLRSESNTSVRVVLANRSGFDAPLESLAWEERASCLNIFRTTNRGRISETFRITRQKTCCASESTRSFACTCEPEWFLMLQLESSWLGGAWIMSQHIREKIAVGSQKPSRITGKRLVAQVSHTRRFALYLRTGVVLMPNWSRLPWEERGSCLNIFRTTNRVGSQKPSRITRQRLVAQVSQHVVRVVLANRSGLMLQLESSRMGGALIMSQHIPDDKSRSDIQKPSRITRQKTCCASESTHVGSRCTCEPGVVLMLQLDRLAWEERGSCPNIFGQQIADGYQKPSRITRQKTCCASESNMSVRIVLANRSGFDAPIGVVLAWEERGSCLNIFRTNRGRISETFTNYEAKGLVAQERGSCLNISGRQIAVGSQKPSRITRQKTCCASESNTSVGVVLANQSGFDAPIGLVSAWDERGSCLNIFRTTNRGRISETFTNYEAKNLLRK
ncbi:uncharacterized protein G2W53_010321 [Senna tora]|uniref:Uncharacterized protein n=1 Tax=Senna tora TaxID=362788 RepID=A0A834WZE7_9FABA|nr:uncharacterized protein G2W53_010321 [Senna tora]